MIINTGILGDPAARPPRPSVASVLPVVAGEKGGREGGFAVAPPVSSYRGRRGIVSFRPPLLPDQESRLKTLLAWKRDHVF